MFQYQMAIKPMQQTAMAFSLSSFLAYCIIYYTLNSLYQFTKLGNVIMSAVTMYM